MSIYNILGKYKTFDYNAYWKQITDNDILSIINSNKLSKLDFLALLSPQAEKFIEPMAQKANQLSLQHFGKSIILYTPMYLANYCVNRCVYCSYNINNNINRKQLTLEEVKKEAQEIAKTGLRHILILTGESKKATPVKYILDSIKIIRKYFESVAIEIYPLSQEEYEQMLKAGADSLTMYQEVYDEDIYDKVHISGPKKNYRVRLDAPELGCRAGMRSVNIGALLGLSDWRTESFKTGLHVNYLQNNYTEVEVSVSLPRIRPHKGAFEQVYPVTDKNLVQIMLALRIFLPYVGITISTRESQTLRNHLIPLGITKMSAGVTTEVGGHSLDSAGEAQFDISDGRSVDEIREAILKRGYQPIFKDWMKLYDVL